MQIIDLVPSLADVYASLRLKLSRPYSIAGEIGVLQSRFSDRNKWRDHNLLIARFRVYLCTLIALHMSSFAVFPNLDRKFFRI